MKSMFALVAALAVMGSVAAEPPAPEGPKVVLRVSRAFVQSLTRSTFDEVTPVATTRQRTTVVGTFRASGGYTVSFQKSPTEAAFDLRVEGTVDADLGATRRPVYAQLDGHASLSADRRVSFDGDSYVGGPVGVWACYRSTLEGIDTLRRGPLAPLVRRVARPMALRQLPEADRAAGEEVRARVRDRVVEQTDGVVEVLNRVHTVREEMAQKLGVGPRDGRTALATTDDALLIGRGFPAGTPPAVPTIADPPAPVEIWLYRPLSAAERVALKRIVPEAEAAWDKKVRPRLGTQLEQYSPDLARRVGRVRLDVTHEPPGAPGWHRIQFVQEVREAAPAP